MYLSPHFFFLLLQVWNIEIRYCAISVMAGHSSAYQLGNVAGSQTQFVDGNETEIFVTIHKETTLFLLAGLRHSFNTMC